MRGHWEEFRAVWETNPQRRAALRLWYEARDVVRALNKNAQFSYCRSGVEVRDVADALRVRWFYRKIMQF